jgi:TRAP-type C4-dicarboxylate transport system permease large subunit
MRSIAPFYGALLVTLLAVTYVPMLSLGLPKWVGG